MFQTGYWTLARYRGIPIRLHWSIPLGALFFGRFEIVPGFWLGFVVLVLIHELGHAFLARRRRLAVFEVNVHGLGGECVHRRGSPYDDAIVAWGGVLAQLLVLYVPTRLLIELGVVTVDSAFVAQLVSALLWTNLWLVAINLLPIPPLDGAKAWQLPKLWWERRKRRAHGHRAPTPVGKASPTRKPAPIRDDDDDHDDHDDEDPAEVARRLAREALESARKRLH